MGRKKKGRNNKYINHQSKLVKKQKAATRIPYQEILDNRREEVEVMLVDKSNSFKKHNLIMKRDDIKKDRGIVGNRSFKELRAGFSNTRNKETYIKKNREHIKNLPLGQQRNLIQLFLRFL